MLITEESQRDFLDRVLKSDKLHELALMYQAMSEISIRQAEIHLDKMVRQEQAREKEYRRMLANNAMVERKQREKDERRRNHRKFQGR